jgi:hypothetical protein
MKTFCGNSTNPLIFLEIRNRKTKYAKMTKLSFWTKVWYGYGNIGNAVKTVVFSTFLFYYYNQLLGLSGKMCGTALLIALCFDAINDPLIGLWSDRMVSKKWGKRLPFMIFGGLPFAISLFFLFIPPAGLSQIGLFFWFIGFAVFTRTAQTFFQIPYLSLGAELTDNYIERSELYGFVQFFGFVGNVSVSGAGFLFFFHSTATYQNGMLNAAMYPWYEKGYFRTHKLSKSNSSRKFSSNDKRCFEQSVLQNYHYRSIYFNDSQCNGRNIIDLSFYPFLGLQARRYCPLFSRSFFCRIDDFLMAFAQNGTMV